MVESGFEPWRAKPVFSASTLGRLMGGESRDEAELDTKERRTPLWPKCPYPKLNTVWIIHVYVSILGKNFLSEHTHGLEMFCLSARLTDLFSLPPCSLS